MAGETNRRSMIVINALAVSFIITLIKSMMDNGLADEIEDLVRAAFNFEGNGDERKARVIAELKDVTGVIGEAFASTSPWIINMLIEALVGKYKAEAEVEENK